ncbi:MAG: 2OG-Fe(II) oxygenase [Candidatus Sericytochromatia bacterium]
MNEEELTFKVNQIVYMKLFDENECKEISKLYTNMIQAQSYSSSIPKFGNKLIAEQDTLVSNDDVRKSKGRCLAYDECKWIVEKLGNKTEELNQKYFKYGNMTIDAIDILEYGISDKCDWHSDMGTTKPFSQRKISIVAFISDRDEYEGGQLEFMPKLKEPLKMEKGYIIAFPAHKIHRVTPVTSGIRRTFVTWLMEA